MTPKEYQSFNDLLASNLQHEVRERLDRSPSAADRIRHEHEFNAVLRAENAQLRALNEYLIQAVELLSLPRVTDDEVRFVRDGLAQLQMPLAVN